MKRYLAQVIVESPVLHRSEDKARDAAQKIADEVTARHPGVVAEIHIWEVEVTP